MRIKNKPITFNLTKTGCHICTSHYINEDGYAKISIKGKIIAVHRLIWIRKNGEIPSNKVIRHTCDNPKCINIEHLLLGTQQDNIKDRVLRGRTARGERQRSAKLKTQDIIKIRNSKESNMALAMKYNVGDNTISNIRLRKTWKHIS